MSGLPEKFLQRMRVQLGDEYDDFIESYSHRAAKAVHINSNKCGDFPLELQPLFPFDSNCRLVTEEGLGKHIYHAAGLYYMQEPSAMLPVLSFDMPKSAKVLDLCAAPGGKTSQLALRTDGIVVANEYDRARAGILRENVTRMGYNNVSVVNMFAGGIADVLPGCFDVVLVDAPCSGEGMFRKNPDAAEQWSPENVAASARRQKEIVKSAAECLRTGGLLIYSTCTFAPEEDEDIAEYIVSLGFLPLEIRAEIAALGRAAGGGVKFYPHLFGEGQFVCVFEKTAKGHVRPPVKIVHAKAPKDAILRLSEIMDISGIDIRVAGGGIIYAALPGLPPPFDFGVRLGQIEKDGRVTPAHNMFTAYGDRVKHAAEVSLSDAERYLRGEEIEADAPGGWGCLKYNGYALGGYKASGGKLKNHYPKSLRN